MPNHSDPTSPDYDPFFCDSYKPPRKKPSRASILATNASQLSIAAMAPAGFQPKEAEQVPEKRTQRPGRAFSTKAGLRFLKANGYLILASEGRTAHIDKKGSWQHFRADLKGKVDAVAIKEGAVSGWQFAGINETVRHKESFMNELSRLGEEKAREMFPSGIWYAEFVRGSDEPVSVARWL